MRITLILLLTAIAMSSSAPTKETVQPFELAMLDKLHQPLFKPVNHAKPQYPRKGETMCKGKVCKVKVDDSEDCQHAVPMDFKLDKMELKKN